MSLREYQPKQNDTLNLLRLSEKPGNFCFFVQMYLDW